MEEHSPAAAAAAAAETLSLVPVDEMKLDVSLHDHVILYQERRESWDVPQEAHIVPEEEALTLIPLDLDTAQWQRCLASQVLLLLPCASVRWSSWTPGVGSISCTMLGVGR